MNSEGGRLENANAKHAPVHMEQVVWQGGRSKIFTPPNISPVKNLSKSELWRLKWVFIIKFPEIRTWLQIFPSSLD